MAHVDALSKDAVPGEPDRVHVFYILIIKIHDWMYVQSADEEIKRTKEI